MKEVIFIYEPGHIEAAAEYAKDSKNECELLAFDFWIGRLLKEKGIESTPMTRYFAPGQDLSETLLLSQTFAHEWYRIPEMRFFTYKGISLGEATETIVYGYLDKALYYLVELQKVVAAQPQGTRFVVPRTTRRTQPGSGPGAKFETSSIENVMKLFADQKGVQVEFLGAEDTGEVRLFAGQPVLMSAAFKIYNALITLLVPKKSVKILASDYWRNLSAILSNMDDVELILVDKKEIKNIPWRSLLKHRVQFRYASGIPGLQPSQDALRAQEQFRLAWPSAGAVLMKFPQLNNSGVSWWPLVEPMLAFLVQRYAERIMSDADAYGRIMEENKINKVLLRASVSSQHHFYLLGALARMRNIPGIELQHGIQINDPNSVFMQLGCEYLAAYGTAMRELYVGINHYPEGRIVPVGSPRFDRYMHMHVDDTERAKQLVEKGLDPKKKTILVGVPFEGDALFPPVYTSYEIASFFEYLSALQKKVPEIQFIFKFRSPTVVGRYREFLAGIFSGKGYYVADADDFFPLALVSDLLLSGNSTLIYETLIGKKPVVLFVKPADRYFAEFYSNGALLPGTFGALEEALRELVKNPAAYAALQKKGREFIEKGYSFDGHASERMRDLLRAPLAGTIT